MPSFSTNRIIRRIRPAPKIDARVTSIGVTSNQQRADTSRQMDEENEFLAGVMRGKIPLVPPYDPLALLRIVEKSNMIKQCVAAMRTNVAECGFTIVASIEGQPIDQKEKDELQSFIDNANSEESFTTVCSKMDDDFESLGYGYIEAIRDRVGRLSMFRHARASTIRLLPREANPIPVTYDIQRGPRTSNITEYKRFRSFIQIIFGNTRYFKEFGDPRRMNYLTGDFETKEVKVSDDLLATELIHFRQNSEDAYGVPCWINQLPSILGSREAEEVNLRYFEDNTIPPMILSVAGGRLTKESFRSLQRMLDAQAVGKERQHKIMLIEATPERESLDDKGSVTLKVDKLTDTRQNDGLFDKYDSANQQKVRSSFRLPPVAVGLSQDVTFACYDQETETLTDQGWITYDKYRDGMRIATIDAAGDIEFCLPNNGILIHEVDNVSMYRVQTEQQDILVTPNHRMMFATKQDGEFRISPIEKMTPLSRVYFKTAGRYDQGSHVDSILVAESDYKGGIAAKDAAIGQMPMDLLLEWIGYYLADGCLRQNGNAVSIGAKKTRKLIKFEALHEALQDLGFRLRISQEQAGTYYTVSHKGFVSWLSSHAGSDSLTKRIPELVWLLPIHQLRILFDALMECDGTWDAREGRTSGAYSTVSKELADGVQRLAVLLGYRTILRQDRPGSFGSQPVYRVLLSDKETCQVHPEKHITRENYTGTVYCFSVPSGVFITRRNGRVAMQGNTANVSAFIAESQVYLPRRRMFDEIYNKRIVTGVNGLRLKTCLISSRVPAITNPQELIKSLTSLNTMGALTPRMALVAANKILELDLGSYPEKGTEGWEEWMDKPIIFVTRGIQSQDGQAQKDAHQKQLEQDGHVSLQQPENGQQ